MNGTFTHKLLKQSLHTTTAPFPLPQNGFTLTSQQCGSILQSLTNTKSFTKGQQLHGHMTTCGALRVNTYLNTKLAAFYATCGRMAEAQLIFDGIELKNSFLWNFMIRGVL